jgi:hypothetical protein
MALVHLVKAGTYGPSIDAYNPLKLHSGAAPVLGPGLHLNLHLSNITPSSYTSDISDYS